jgi:regulator of RNase E activity RraA
MPEWNSQQEMFEICRRELYTAVVGDICDQLGRHRQFLMPQIRPLQQGYDVPLLVGRVMPVLEADISAEPVTGTPFGLMLEALDDLRPDEIYLCAGASPRYALVGELMCTAMLARGAAGVVCEGYVRDAAEIIRLGFPVYCFGSYAQDQRGRGMVVDYRVTIEINGVQIVPGDLLLGDGDGVLIVPQTMEAEILTKALAKARREDTVRQALLASMPAREAFAKYGVL